MLRASSPAKRLASSPASSAAAEKPPYRLPSMTEARAVPQNGLTVVSTFSGAGGSCLGFRLAGFRTLWASEFVKEARETYRRNFPGVPCDPRDIRLVSGVEVREAAAMRPVEEIDVLEGSPPCASFSMSGKRERHWGRVRKYSDTAQRVDDLFYEFIRLVTELRPRVFVGENVAGLTKGVAVGTCKRILAAMRATGYAVDAQLLDAQWLGVPQHRERIIFVGVRPDVGRPPAFPRPLPYRYSLRDALPELFGDPLAYVGSRTGRHFRKEQIPADSSMRTINCTPGDYQVRYNRKGRVFSRQKGVDGRDITDTPAPTVLAGSHPSHFQIVNRSNWAKARGGVRSVELPAPCVQAYGMDGGGPHQILLDHYAISSEAGRLAPGQGSKKYANLRRAHADRPSPCITQAGGYGGTAAVIHPTEKRKFTIAELKRICAFPDDFILTGTFAQQWERLGRAVPPLMMYAVARTIRDEVLA